MGKLARRFPSHKRWKRKYRMIRRFHLPGRAGKRRFTEAEKRVILEHLLCDTEIAQRLHTSIDSVQTKRCRLKKPTCTESA